MGMEADYNWDMRHNEKEETMDFTKFPKIPRMNRQVVITEKIDGTNAQVFIDYSQAWKQINNPIDPIAVVGEFGIWAGSRKRWIKPGDDNFGFAQWVKENAESLIDLGPGVHYGEWWGWKIQRGYNMPKGSRFFSLFNSGRWGNSDLRPDVCDCVPVLYEGDFNTEQINVIAEVLRETGSFAAPGFMKPEGIVVFHKQANLLFKVTLEGDEYPKSLVKEGA
jgi:hypothetical protein